MSPKTLWNMRRIVTDNELDSIIFNQTTDTLAKVFNVDISKQRLDSVHIRSNMRSLGRIRIFAVTIRKFLVNLKRHHKEFFKTIDERFIDRYLTKDALSCFSMVKPSESAKTLETVSSDLFELVRTKHKKNRHVAVFKIEHCGSCPFLKGCPVKAGKKYYYLRYEDKVWRIAMRRAHEKTDEFKDKYRWRAGVEATMSEYDRKTGVKNLRVRGMKAVRLCATLKAVGINIFRATAFRRAKISPKPIQKWACWCVSRLWFYVKEQYCALLSKLGKMFPKSTFSTGFSCRPAG